MKVGIMSMQRVRNYGSFLQAYGLKKTIESLGHDVEFVDYRTTVYDGQVFKRGLPITPKTLIRYIKHRSTAKNRRMYSRAAQFDLYYDSFLPELGVNDEMKYQTEVDTLVIGSDEVFNCFQHLENKVDSFDLFGVDNHAQRCITYAASFGSTTFEKIRQSNDKTSISEALKDFDSISVRDDNTNCIISKLTERDDIIKNVDPVLVYDFEPEFKLYESKDPYIVVYSYRGRLSDQEGKIIKEFAEKQNMKLLCVGGIQGFCDDYLLLSPFEVLGLFKNAKYVVTDTFHGTVMSIKYGKKFATIIRDNNRQKISDLLKTFELTERQVSDYNQLQHVIHKDYDKDLVNKKLKAEKQKAIDYLSENI